MKFGYLDRDNTGVFAAFIPPLPTPSARRRLYLGLYENELALGAAVIDLGPTDVELVSLVWDESLPDGQADRELASMLCSALEDSAVEQIFTVRQGTPEELEQMDREMCAAGYFSLPSPIRDMEATLDQVVQAARQQKLLELKTGSSSVPLSQVPPQALRQYFREAPWLPVGQDELDPVTSRFWLAEGQLQAALLTSKSEEGLTVEWLSSTDESPTAMACLVRDAILAAQEAYPPETTVALAAGIPSVDRLVQKLGFTANGSLITRVYKRYIN